MALKLITLRPNQNPIIEGPGLGGLALVLKENDTARASNDTSTSDPELILPLQPNERWLGQFVIWYTGEADGDLKTHLEIPAGATGRWGVSGIVIAATTFSGDITVESTTDFDSGTPISVGGPEAAADAMLIIPFVVTVGATAGNLSLFWAQRVSDVTATTIRANSYIQAQKL